MNVSGQPAVNYLYDHANHTTQITQGTSAATLTYDADARRKSLMLPNGITITYSYDAASQLSTINYQLGNSSLGNLTYNYDVVGRRTGLGGSYARLGTPQVVSGAAYNANNQLT
jgi:YD repeat-containing protein